MNFPVLLLRENFEIVFANKRAREIAQKEESRKCFEFLFGFSEPCGRVPGYGCPLEGIVSGRTEHGLTVNNYPIKGKFKRCLIEIFRASEDLYVETLFDYDQILEAGKEDNPYYIPKASLLKLIQKLLDEDKVFFVSVINIKKLKSINQFFGLSVGDRIIETIEKILRELAFKYHFYYSQVAGGYFVVVVSENDSKPYKIEKEIFSYIEKMQELYNLPVNPKISMVTSQFSPLITKDADDVFKILFYAEKFLAKSSEVLYLNAEIIDKILTNLGLKRKVISTLEDILKRHLVDVHFQPIVDLSTGKISHFETLIRIKQNGNAIPIGKFIELIYELNLIVDFDLQVLDKLNEYLPKLAKIGKKVYINISSIDLKNEEYRERLLKTVRRFNDNGVGLSLEITEQVIFDEMEFLEQLSSSYDLKFAIDDFGTGYSSLKLVIDLISKGIVDAIKLDCSLVRSYFENKEAKAIINSVVGFSRQLNLETIAECVETEEQAKTLKEIGVSHAQGWYFYKPMPIDELLKLPL